MARCILTGMAEFRVSSWNELTEHLYTDAWQAPLGRFRSKYAYRGMQHIDSDLSTTLRRLGGPFANHEGHLLRNFRKYAHRDAVPGDSVWNWLSLAKHHGLPTRLLDWSFSPFVAMHFATQDIDAFAVDGVIWLVDYAQVHRLLPARLRRILREEAADVFTAEMLGRASATLPGLDRLAGRGDFALFFEPPSLDDRIVNQYALFSLMSSASASLDEWLQDHPTVTHRVVIPAELKWEIRDKLDQANITERVLFPGLDGLSRWLTRYFSPRLEHPSEVQLRPDDMIAPLPQADERALRGGAETSPPGAAARSNGRRAARSARARRGT
jgi:hypothetical protein